MYNSTFSILSWFVYQTFGGIINFDCCLWVLSGPEGGRAQILKCVYNSIFLILSWFLCQTFGGVIKFKCCLWFLSGPEGGRAQFLNCVYNSTGPNCPGPNCPGPCCPGPNYTGPNLPRAHFLNLCHFCFFAPHKKWQHGFIHSKSESRDSNDPAKKLNFPQICPKMAQCGPNMTPNDLKWPKMAQEWPKMAQKWPKMA